MRIEDFLSRLQGVRKSGGGSEARCPAHEDRRASLTIREAEDGKILVNCHAGDNGHGCSHEAITAALGLTPRDLFAEHDGARQARPREQRIARLYPYVSETGELLFEVVRFDPKGFRQRRPDGNGVWAWNLNGVRRVLYRLPRVLETAKAGGVVYVVEGEKDAEALEALGLVATCNAGGAGKWRPEYVDALRGVKGAVILPDNDPAGRAHALGVARSLHAAGVPVKVLELPNLPEKGDVSDWLAAGKTKAKLLALQKAAPLWNPTEAEAPAGGAVVVRLADVERERVEWLWPGRFPLGKLVLLDGDPDVGKTTVALDLAARLTRGLSMPGEERGSEPVNVLLLMAEDGLGDTIRPRLEAAGADLARVFALRGVPTPEGGERLPMLPEDGELIRAEAERIKARVIFLDPLFAYVSPDCNIFRDQDVRRALQPLVRIGEDLGCSAMVLRHLNKAPGGKALYRGGGSIGIIGAARAGLLVAEDPDDNSRRVLAVVKCNLGPKAPALAYRLVPEQDVARVAWEGPTEHTPAQLLAGPPEEEAGVGREAEEFLREALAPGARPSSELIGEARQAGISERTLWRAKRRLGVVARKEGRPGGTGQRWTWALPDGGPEGCHETSKPAIQNGWQPSEGDGRLREEWPVPEEPPEVRL